MGHVTYGDGIAIFQLVYFSPALLSSIIVAGRHGLMKNSGWIFLTIFCIVRIVGASARLATITNPSSHTASTISLVCSVLGLSPLLMASLGLISRAYYSIFKQPWNTIFSLFIVKIVHTPAVIALILCIVGATNASTPEQIESQSTVHIGVILYTVVFVLLMILTLGAYLSIRRAGEGEAFLVLAVTCALPFIFIRLLYSLLSAFSHLPAFNPVTGSETATLFMSVLEEMVVVLIYIATGLKLPAVPENISESPGGTLAYRFGRGDFGTGKLGLFSLGLAGFQAFKKSQKSPDTGNKRNMTENGRENQRDYR